MFKKNAPTLPKLTLRAFAAAIAQSVCKANEMLEQDHLESVRLYGEAGMAAILPPPPPLLIRNVKVKFNGKVSEAGPDQGADELQLDLSCQDGNFKAELEFEPFSEDLLQELLRSQAAPAFPSQQEEPQYVRGDLTQLETEPDVADLDADQSGPQQSPSPDCGGEPGCPRYQQNNMM